MQLRALSLPETWTVTANNCPLSKTPGVTCTRRAAQLLPQPSILGAFKAQPHAEQHPAVMAARRQQLQFYSETRPQEWLSPTCQQHSVCNRHQISVHFWTDSCQDFKSLQHITLLPSSFKLSTQRTHLFYNRVSATLQQQTENVF